MEARFHNTLTGKKEIFTPIHPGKVGMYHCGPTVYDYAHIGNLRAYVLADLIRRWCEHSSTHHTPLEVTQVINITDVGHLTGDNDGNADSGEDRMEKGAAREDATVKEITDKYTKAFHDDLVALNIRTHDAGFSQTLFPKASEHIKEQIELIKKLQELGFTYEVNDGIYFDTARFPEYGKLGHINLSGLKEGARVEAVAGKRNPSDFALWKFSGAKSRLQEWNPGDFGADFAIGFPGWHLECSAMSMKYLGDHFDIHTGGIDHIPVHHNNEIAQSEGATNTGRSGADESKPFVDYWLHSAFLTVDGKKIGKSLGNAILLSDFKKIPMAGGQSIDPLAYKYFLLTAHYSTPVNFTWEAVLGAEKALTGLRASIAEEKDSKTRGVINSSYFTRFEEKMADDLATPQAIAILWELAKDKTVSRADKRATFIAADEMLGLNLDALHDSAEIYIPEHIQKLKNEYAAAKENKDYTTSDRIRAEIAAQGYTTYLN